MLYSIDYIHYIVETSYRARWAPGEDYDLIFDCVGAPEDWTKAAKAPTLW